MQNRTVGVSPDGVPAPCRYPSNLLPPPVLARYARKKKDKDTSLPTMVKLEYSASSGRAADEDWERDGRERGDVPGGGLVSHWLGGLGSPPAVTPQSADV